MHKKLLSPRILQVGSVLERNNCNQESVRANLGNPENVLAPRKELFSRIKNSGKAKFSV